MIGITISGKAYAAIAETMPAGPSPDKKLFPMANTEFGYPWSLSLG